MNNGLGLGSERKYGFNRDERQVFLLDTFLKKMKKNLNNNTYSQEELVKIQARFDNIVDKYKDKCTKEQLSQLYKVQSLIYKKSGDRNLARIFSDEGRMVAGKYKKYNKIFLLLLLLILISFIFFSILTIIQDKKERIKRLNECVSIGKTHANADAENIVFNSGIKRDNDINGERDALYTISFERVYEKSVIECNNKFQTENKDENIKNAKAELKKAEEVYQNFLDKLKAEEEKKEDFNRQLLLESVKHKQIYCNSYAFGSSISTSCY